MSFWEIVWIGLGLSMDACAASICKGLSMSKMWYGQSFRIGLFFGGFQALMPMLGWMLGRSFSRYMQAFDHWIAFVLLGCIGGKMIWDTLHKEESTMPADCAIRTKELLLLAIATSLDALAIGVAFACLEVNIYRAVAIIGGVTFCVSVLGVWIGSRFGNRFHRHAGLVGGLTLLWIGVKILIEHLIQGQ